MRTTLVAIVLWALATIALCVLGIWATARALDRPRDRGPDPTRSLMSMLADDTARAFEEGGPEGLAIYLRRLANRLPGERFLVDSRGRDLADGSDRADLVESAGAADFAIAGRPDGRLAAVIRPRGGRYRFVWLVEPWFEPPSPWPFIAVVVAIIAAMGSALALYLSVPLRRLRRVMDRFGRGDLRARVGSRRRDEIGVVSREFDLLAERVETLVAAERRLLQDVSHELRSPLTRLDVAVGLAIRREDRGPLLERIRRDVSRLSELVGELLHLTRVEGDPSARVLEVVRLGELLGTLLEDCTIEAESKGCRLAYEASWPGPMRGDPELLRRAFENVIRNAIRHAPEGSDVEVSLEPCGQGAKVIVRDFGSGVPAEALPSLFEPFFRVEGDRSRESGGVGLGLAIARRAVAIHGGRIEARNAEPGLAVEMVLPGS
ncbi:Sensor protein CpxA [Aquisphaera giovannonii]|uniref:histidine kinase n=1 Tax=Aquisphaera giovannonii TaxID=406548 RepID=A0A5B9WCX2_9BACT|nr:ATP-binding protein [Aquisphaera giovannonii]QEH38456.1 Sensor protein CpxA [Aquisphaera giovannonii]